MTSENVSSSLKGRSVVTTMAGANHNATTAKTTDGKAPISKMLPKYPKEERRLPPKKRKVPVDYNSSVVPTTILLRQVASCWDPPTTVSRESSPSSGSPLYLERYGEKALSLYPNGPQTALLHKIEPCADPVDLQLRYDKEHQAAAVAVTSTAKTAKARDSHENSLETAGTANMKSTDKGKPQHKDTPKNKDRDKPTENNEAQEKEDGPSRQGVVTPAPQATANVVPHPKQGASLVATPFLTTAVSYKSKILVPSPLKRKNLRQARAPAADALPFTNAQGSTAPSTLGNHDTASMSSTRDPMAEITVGHVQFAVPLGGMKQDPLTSAPPGPDRTTIRPAFQPVRKIMPTSTANGTTTSRQDLAMTRPEMHSLVDGTSLQADSDMRHRPLISVPSNFGTSQHPRYAPHHAGRQTAVFAPQGK